ncbi:MAG TPA: penicillin-binding transpeptidase domain-containing protein [Pyrinomonadaceae bacterium]|nr:penicillin-binding transpeptidase domain-containing protein [Pyrinomonadaceae bacterium]
MYSIHNIARLASALFLLFALSFTISAATRHPAKAPSHARAEKRQSPAKNQRAERLRAEARRRAEIVRLEAIARQRALDEAMRANVQSMIERDDVSGEDPEIRRVAVNALGHHAGTVVVMDPQTGRIYTVVNQQWALREGFKPCSTIKLVTGLAGLNEKIIDPTNTAAISYTNRVDLTSALAHSKNDYFQQVGGQVGFNKMISYARDLGLGEKTGINLQNETKGSVPKLKSGLAVNHMSSHGDDFKVTALQLATLVSAMANGGKLITPFVPRTEKDEKRSAPKVRRLLNINADSFQQMIPGMIGSVSYGSGRRAFNSQEIIAGKTGTCIEQGTWIGLFTSYAPQNNPRLAVVVIARGADGRNHFPVTVAGRIYRDLNGRFGTPADIAASRSSNAQTRRVDKKASLTEEKEAVATDDDESDTADDDSTPIAGATVKTSPPKTIWGDQRTPPDSKVRRVIMPIPGRSAAPAKPVGAKSSSRTKSTDSGKYAPRS